MHRKAPMTKPGARVRVRKKMAYYVARPSGIVREFPMPNAFPKKRSHRHGQSAAQYRASIRNLKKARAARRRRRRR